MNNLLKISHSIKNSANSFSTRLGLVIGALMYLSYSFLQGSWSNAALISLSCFIGLFIPFYSKFSNRIDEHISLRTARITPGRIGRFAAQFIFNIGVFFFFIRFQVIENQNLATLGGLVGIAALTTSLSQGLQYLALSLSNREIGNKNTNVIIALSVNIVVTAIATLGVPQINTFYFYFALANVLVFFGIGLLSDIRSFIYPNHGVGIFFGTFNPIHTTHLQLIKNLINERNVSVIYLHATVIPKLHRDSLARGEIEIIGRENGMRVYSKTLNADVHVNYFPTGNRFFEFKTRCELVRIAIAEMGLSEKVKVLAYPEIYESRGFYGIIDSVRKNHPNSPIHGIHGSDLGGMWVRNIYDESGWIYPYSVRRTDNVSATAIRNGAKGLTTQTVAQVLEYISRGIEKFKIGKKTFCIKEGVLNYD